jgi:hypothetical protein
MDKSSCLNSSDKSQKSLCSPCHSAYVILIIIELWLVWMCDYNQMIENNNISKIWDFIELGQSTCATKCSIPIYPSWMRRQRADRNLWKDKEHIHLTFEHLLLICNLLSFVLSMLFLGHIFTFSYIMLTSMWYGYIFAVV